MADNTKLAARVLDVIGNRSGYYVVGESRSGPFAEADSAYALWERDMQGEVMYFDGARYYYMDGRRA